MEQKYQNKSMVGVAYEVLKSHEDPMLFKDLFNEVCAILELSEDEKRAIIAKFYTNLSLDGRFVDLKDNNWDLRDRQTYDKVHIDMNAVYSDIDAETSGNLDAEELDEDEKAESGISDSDEDDSIDGITDEGASLKED